MSIFTAAEIGYMSEQRLGRLATITKKGDPHVIPVNYMYNPAFECIDIIGRDMVKSMKYKNIVGFGRASFVVDDVVSLMPFQTRLLHIRGRAEIVIRKPTDPVPVNPSAPLMSPEQIATRLQMVSPEMIRIHPEMIVAGGLADDPAEMVSRTYGPDGKLVAEHRHIEAGLFRGGQRAGQMPA